ncbi:unnamed protein product [Zymoseptoria tritici ST99CH_1E4]|uniref:Tf2-1-like SH3-like domain-containing protein n=1 Tax=Zymoseptoria tritici ST99CH_1E4 TaxID=1276532 RepID=A0A2H1FMQ0_ZYMTR|nr:unnamed protein product [Zymoseptoria tritici ST99CH_1E4]
MTRQTGYLWQSSQLTTMYAANLYRDTGLVFQVGDIVRLNRKNIKTKRPSISLDHKFLGPYKVIKVMPGACRLQLPPDLKIDDIFNNALLRPAADNPLPGQSPALPPPAEAVVDSDGEHEEYEVEEVLDMRTRKALGRKSKKPPPPSTQYLVH